MRLSSGAFFAANAAKNRAFRSKSSDAPMRFLWAFRSNPFALAAAPNQATRISADGSAGVWTRRRQFFWRKIARKGSSKNFHFMISSSKGKNCCGTAIFSCAYYQQ
jgi:hypothetical protein